MLTVAGCPARSNVVSTVAVLPGTACCVLNERPRPSKKLVAESLRAGVIDFNRVAVMGKLFGAEKLKLVWARKPLLAGSGGVWAEVMRNM